MLIVKPMGHNITIIVIYLSLYMPNHTFTLIGSHDILEDRCIDDITIKKAFCYFTIFKLPQITDEVKHGKNISDTLQCTTCTKFLF